MNAHMYVCVSPVSSLLAPMMQGCCSEVQTEEEAVGRRLGEEGKGD